MHLKQFNSSSFWTITKRKTVLIFHTILRSLIAKIQANYNTIFRLSQSLNFTNPNEGYKILELLCIWISSIHKTTYFHIFSPTRQIIVNALSLNTSCIIVQSNETHSVYMLYFNTLDDMCIVDSCFFIFYNDVCVVVNSYIIFEGLHR